MPFAEREPHIHIEDGPDGRVSIHIRHYGRVPDLTREFSPEVLRRAVNKWRRTSREHRIMKAAWGLSWTGYRLVEAHLIRERALAIEYEMQLKAERKAARRARRASWSLRSAEAQQLDEREVAKTERAAYYRQPGDGGRGQGQPLSRPVPTKDEAELAKEQSWLDALLAPLERPPEPQPTRVVSLTELARREQREGKTSIPKLSRADRKTAERLRIEREESRTDLFEFKPRTEQPESLTVRARRMLGVEPALPEVSRDRDKDRSR